ncbi:MAG TPA: NAD(P)-dependent oxidoreductase [Microbacteriaceae bacterium]|nr:NAD(P)-dependent oxidoreductase [Microbacteriaceae bacterium]
MTEKRIGFIGLGNMGGRMTGCIVRAGQEVLGFDTKTENIAAVGASPAASVAEVVENTDLVFLSLPNSHIIESIAYGDGGLVAHAHAGQVIVDLSTAAPSSTRKIHDALFEKGANYLDAGISGGAARAEKADLTLMVGGNATVLDSVRAELGYFASNIFYIGVSGTGHITKLLNNFLNAVSLSATAEVMVAAKKANLDLETVLKVLNTSSGVNFATTNRFPKIIHGDYLKGGLTNSLMLKDITLYTELAAQLGVASLNSSGPVAAFGLARALGYADEISNTVVDAIGDVSGGVRLHEGTSQEAAR